MLPIKLKKGQSEAAFRAAVKNAGGRVDLVDAERRVHMYKGAQSQARFTRRLLEELDRAGQR
jgi:hypothetical protein